MHIIIAILGALAAAFWAFTHFMNAANQGRETVRDVGGVIRRGQWNRRVDKRLIENLSDPREAAAVLLYQIAAYDGHVTDRQYQSIVAEMREVFEADEETAEGLYAFGRMAVGEINDAGNSVRKILRPVTEICTPAEKRELVEVLERTAEIEGPPSDVQRRLILEARRVLLDA
ncbi:TerB family tellurite resistance protein [Hyphococcus sp.]|uniref:TerB family tellurite resistance protein n=1 Tax=Hyphococcus sp. TaxID=2038636 RepID=UPI003CCBD99C